MKNIYLKKNEERRLLQGHLWVFSNEINRTDENIENGDLVQVLDSTGKLLGVGFFNKTSLIAVRILSKNIIKSLKEFFTKRILSANSIRKELYPNRNSYRMVFGESDYIPGLIIDKYNDTFVIQVNSLGIQRNIELIIDILKSTFNANTILSKNEKHFRILEGLEENDEIYYGTPTNELIDDGKIKYDIDFSSSQKTGFYFDQVDNRNFIEVICKNKKVIDAFCNSGGFGLHAGIAGADEVTFIDSSAREISTVKKNITLNQLEINSQFKVGDIFDVFEQFKNDNHKFDVVMIDPPSFAKTKKNLSVAIKGYERINQLAISLIESGGYLVTSSCSFHLKKEDFMRAINKAARKQNRDIQLIHFNNASLDHPQLPAMEETNYLKFAVLKVS
jgi:23S rRNA (cytosine1962-C5)-methyltransferase